MSNGNGKHPVPLENRVHIEYYLTKQFIEILKMAAIKGSGVNYNDVEKVILDMLASGTDEQLITLNAVKRLSGGRSENVAKYYHEFFTKRNNEVNSIADELGSSEIGKLIASAVRTMIERESSALSSIVEKQKNHIAELIELLEEKQSQCDHEIELAEAKSNEAINEASKQISTYKAKLDEALQHKAQADSELEAVKLDAEQQIKAAQTQADALVSASNKQLEKVEAEAQTLRNQVKELSIDEATRQLEKVALEQAQQNINDQQETIATNKTELASLRVKSTESDKTIARLESELIEVKQLKKAALEQAQKSINDQQETIAANNSELVGLRVKSTESDKTVTRLESELIETKATLIELSKTQGQLLESEKQISELKVGLAQSERERDSLSQALSASKTTIAQLEKSSSNESL